MHIECGIKPLCAEQTNVNTDEHVHVGDIQIVEDVMGGEVSESAEQAN